MPNVTFWKEWLRLRRIVPIVVILVAVVTLALDIGNQLTTHAFEQLVVLAIGLLAVDALIERIALLEKTESAIDILQTRVESLPDRDDVVAEVSRVFGQITRPQGLKDRSTLRVDFITGAREVDICGITLVNLLMDQQGVLSAALSQGAHVRLMLLKPASHQWNAWNDAVTNEDMDAHLKTSLAILKRILKHAGSGQCEIRYSPYLLPTCLVVADATRPTGRLVAEMVFPDLPGHDRPHVALSKADDRRWFDFFTGQFEGLWQKSEVVQLPV